VKPEKLPLTVLMITLNEEHNIGRVLENIVDFSSEIFILDSFSQDRTLEIASKYDVKIYQREFKDFSDQWNYACQKLPISNPWTIKLDPDESLTNELKQSISEVILKNQADYISFNRRLWFMSRPLSVKQKVTRVWKTGTCRFNDVIVNEHPIVEGKEIFLNEYLEHYDSPDLQHWFAKQNIYTTLEAKTRFSDKNKKQKFDLFGNFENRKSSLKSFYSRLIFQDFLIFFYCYFILGSFKDGKVGFIWAKMRCFVYKMRRLKYLEMSWIGKEYNTVPPKKGLPNVLAKQIYNDS